eukprot:Seg3059.1 transcript_id=Seg3059.1/GoldUCD/mRNA.D3Y31 product="hypothetical protein" protein_id=Seg3059.1/GoldUCD/D3Y31
MAKSEVLENMAFYSNWSNEGSNIEEELERYVKDRAYGTDSSDLVVNALANSLCVTIRILEIGATGEEYTLYTLPQVPGRRKEQPRAVLDVLKSGEHYDALVATNNKQSEKVWQQVGKRKSSKRSAPSSTTHVKLENRYSAIDTESDPENGIGHINDFDPPCARQSTPKKKKRKLPMSPTRKEDVINLSKSNYIFTSFAVYEVQMVSPYSH